MENIRTDYIRADIFQKLLSLYESARLHLQKIFDFDGSVSKTVKNAQRRYPINLCWVERAARSSNVTSPIGQVWHSPCINIDKNSNVLYNFVHNFLNIAASGCISKIFK